MKGIVSRMPCASGGSNKNKGSNQLYESNWAVWIHSSKCNRSVWYNGHPSEEKQIVMKLPRFYCKNLQEVSEIMHINIIRITFFYFVHRPVFCGTQHFGNWICFRPQVRNWETSTLLGPLETVYPSHWTPSPEDGNMSSFRNVVFFSIPDDRQSPKTH
jgi:hypothetical protein